MKRKPANPSQSKEEILRGGSNELDALGKVHTPLRPVLRSSWTLCASHCPLFSCQASLTHTAPL